MCIRDSCCEYLIRTRFLGKRCQSGNSLSLLICCSPGIRAVRPPWSNMWNVRYLMTNGQLFLFWIGNLELAWWEDDGVNERLRWSLDIYLGRFQVGGVRVAQGPRYSATWFAETWLIHVKFSTFSKFCTIFLESTSWSSRQSEQGRDARPTSKSKS